MANEARVLIIEDNDALRVMLFTVLRHQPLAVDTAPSIDTALDRIATCDYALILIDLSLPDGDGLAFLQRFREARPDATTFVIAVKDPALELPLDMPLVSAVLNKPLEIDTLAVVVRECALVVPPPEEPLDTCPPAESDVVGRFDSSGSYFAN